MGGADPYGFAVSGRPVLFSSVTFCAFRGRTAFSPRENVGCYHGRHGNTRKAVDRLQKLNHEWTRIYTNSFGRGRTCRSPWLQPEKENLRHLLLRDPGNEWAIQNLSRRHLASLQTKSISGRADRAESSWPRSCSGRPGRPPIGHRG